MSDTNKRNDTAADTGTEMTRKPKRDLKEIIEMHAEIQRAKQRQLHEMSPLSERVVRKRASPLGHNKPLPSMIRPVQAMMLDRKASIKEKLIQD